MLDEDELAKREKRDEQMKQLQDPMSVHAMIDRLTCRLSQSYVIRKRQKHQDITLMHSVKEYVLKNSVIY